MTICAVLKNVFSIIVKPVILAECATAYKVMKTYLKKKDSNLVDDAKIKTGLVTVTLMKKPKNDDDITQVELKQFYKEVKSFVLATISKLYDKIPVSSKIVHNRCIFNPYLMSATNLDVLIKRVKILVAHLVDADWVDAQIGDKMITQFPSFLESNNFAFFK